MTASPAEPVRFLTDSLKIYSPTEGESEFAGFLSDRMGAFGYRNVRTDRAGNVTGDIGSGKERILLCGHMDTVPGRLKVWRNKEYVFGRGASDAKSPLCALLLGGASAADSGAKVTFAGVTEEEGDGAGIEELIKRKQAYDFAVFGEPSGARRITVGYRGRVGVKVTVRTTGGHAGASWAHHSAFDEFASALSRARAYEASMKVEGDHFHSLSVTPTLVRAGSFHNVVPGLCEATLDVRVPPPMRSSDAVKGIDEAMRSGDDAPSIRVEPGEPTEPYEADTGSTIVRAFQRAILLNLKAKPALVRKTGTGDMNTFAHKRGTECITYGPGDPLISHTDAESVGINDYLDSIKVVGEAIRQASVIAGGSRT